MTRGWLIVATNFEKSGNTAHYLRAYKVIAVENGHQSELKLGDWQMMKREREKQ